jgi:GT2 family glycosyltransferase/spore maturation protein CgeB
VAVDRQIAELSERLEALSEELADTRAERQRLVHELTERSRAQSEAREAVAALEQRLVAQERELSSRDREASTQKMAEAIRELDRELGARLADLGAARAELDALRFESQKHESELRDRADDAEQRLADAERHTEDLRTRLRAAEEERARLANELGEARARESELATADASARAHADALGAELERTEREIRTLRDALDQERQTRSSVEGRLTWHEQQLRARESELAAAGRSVSRLQDMVEELKTGHQAALEERDRKNAERAKAIEERDRVELERKRIKGELGAALSRAEQAEAHAAQTEAQLAARTREHQQLVGELGLRISDVRADVERISTSRAWRWGHRITRALRLLTFRKPRTEGAVTRAMKRLDEASMALGGVGGRPAIRPPHAQPADEDSDESHHPGPDPRARAELARQIRERLGPVPQIAHWPRVSLVVLNRNGAPYLRALFTGLGDATDYPDFEVIVVDNASTDDSLDFLRGANPSFPLEVVANEANASFSEANNQGAAVVTGELLLFANNDIEPFESGWLRELVACQSKVGAAVGATLLHAEGRQPTGAPPYAVQHHGIRFRNDQGFPKGVNLGGHDPLGPQLGVDADVPAVTAACMLVRRDTFRAVGGFSPGYRYGTEDVDLGLKLQAAGVPVVCSGRAVLLHHESPTQDAEGRDFMRANRTVNRRLFLERWGARLTREIALERLCGGGGFWTDARQPHVAITRTSNDIRDGWGDWYTAEELGTALERAGWRVSYVQRKGDDWYTLPPGVDFLLLMMDVYDQPRAGDVPTIAWVRNWTERWLEREWFDRVHVVFASSGRSARLIEAATGRLAPLLPIATNPERFRPVAPGPELASDYVFTGNHWGVRRDIEDAIDPRPGERFRIYGKGWSDVPEMKAFAGGDVAYDMLPAIYSSTKIVIDDTAGPTLPYGAVNSRVFDALASGAAVVTNCESGVRELFDDDFPVWSSRDSLRTQLDRLLGDNTGRAALVARYRSQVLAEHTYERRAQQLIDELRRRAEALSFCIKIGAPDRAQAERWGDLYFARALRRQLERRGHPCRIQVLSEWEDGDGLADDIVVHLKGLSRYRPKSGQFNVMWVISHPELVSAEECDGFDLVAVASERFATSVRAMTRTPVIVLEQASDPDVFFPEADPAFRHAIAYVGNSRNVMRKGLADLLPTPHDLAVYGSNWERLIDSSLVAAEHVPNRDLHKVYASAAVVLNDHWDDMREHGFISNRIYDVLASGGVVVSDSMQELAAFGDAVVTYDGPDDLRATLDRLLSDSAERERRAAVGRDLILAGHTFSHRADALLAAVHECMRDQGFATRIRAAASSAVLASA